MFLIMFILDGAKSYRSVDAIIYTAKDTNEDPLLDFLDLGLMKDK